VLPVFSFFLAQKCKCVPMKKAIVAGCVKFALGMATTTISMSVLAVQKVRADV
jgi:hypothetical protein